MSRLSQPVDLFGAVVRWVENGQAPDSILASRTLGTGTQSRPLCPYPMVAKWSVSSVTPGESELDSPRRYPISWTSVSSSRS